MIRAIINPSTVLVYIRINSVIYLVRHLIRQSVLSCSITLLICWAKLGAGEAAPPWIAGPVGPGTPVAKWGACVKDERRNEWLWFGGTGGMSASGALLTWRLQEGNWRRAEYPMTPLCRDALALTSEARALHAAIANRYYLAETTQTAAARLETEARKLATAVDALPLTLARHRGLAKEATQGLATVKAGRPGVDALAGTRTAWLALQRLGWSLGAEPPPRSYPGLAYDAQTETIVLFGGEGEHGAMNDTWLYDCKTRTWSEAQPALAPSPRCAHGMVAGDGKAWIVAGFEPFGSMGYCAGLWARLPAEIWEFDLAGRSWRRLSAGEGAPQQGSMQPAYILQRSADGKQLSWSADILSYGKKKGELTGSLALPGGDAGTAQAGTPPGTLRTRGVGFDPAWYEAVPPADAEATAAALAALPANIWVNVKPPVRHVNRDWGTTVLDLDRDQLLHWAGGHSSHCGTDVAHYSLPLNRWHILYTPELPFENTYSNDGAPVPPLTVKPWGPHSYLSYAWDEISGKMIWAGRHVAFGQTNPGGLWTYDPATYTWSAEPWKFAGGTFDVERHKTCMVRTPKGIVLWADKTTGSGGPTGLWLADVQARTFRPLAATEAKDSSLPRATFGDNQGIAYDAKRDRVLLFQFALADKAKIWACALKTGAISVLTPANAERFPDVSMGREATWLPDEDLVLVPSRGKPQQRTLVYDCAADAWLEMPGACTAGDKPDPGYGVSTGVEWDPKRKLLWLVQTDGAVYAMRFQRASAGLKPLP